MYTASYFGEVRRRLPTTPPESLVLRILGVKTFSYSPATEWGKQHEEVALTQYEQRQHESGHDNLYYTKSGFIISEEHPFLGASPDAVVFDPTNTEKFGLAEVKWPYAHRNVTPIQASTNKDFCSVLTRTDDGNEHLTLRRNHISTRADGHFWEDLV